MTDRLAHAFAVQAEACAALGSPFMGRLMRGLAQGWPKAGALAERVAEWAGDLGPSGASIPLRVAGGLHALVRAGRAAGLAACYPPHVVEDRALFAALAQVLRAEDGFFAEWITRAPQTNEVGRSAVLLAGAAVAVARFGLPLELSELGASAGLNLWFDRYALRLPGGRLGAADPVVTLTPDWVGALPPVVDLQVVARRGVDLAPLDPEHDGARLMAYLWPDQPERLARAAAALARAVPVVDAGDAAGWLEARLAGARPGRLHLVYHTIAHQYFPTQTQARIARALAEAGARATEAAPLAHLSMEADGGEGAAVWLQVWPGGGPVRLGRAGFHGQWLRWGQ